MQFVKCHCRSVKQKLPHYIYIKELLLMLEGCMMGKYRHLILSNLVCGKLDLVISQVFTSHPFA